MTTVQHACRRNVISPEFMLQLIVAALAVLSVVTGCGQDEKPTATEIELRVMTFNIEWGGTHVSFDNVVEAVRRSNADIVGIQEAEGNLQRLAERLGWHYDLRNYVISEYPLIEPSGANGLYVLVEIRPGKVVALANVHLPSDPYGVDLVRDGATKDEVLELERVTRLPRIMPYLAVLKTLVDNDVPTFLTGDFNAPAHTDWIAEMVGERPFLFYPLEWPVSRAVEGAGFHDSWRVAHPDPKKDPGLTWWAGRPPLELYAPGENDAEDRIDFVWFAGPARVLSSALVGEADEPGVTISVMPWPSDHRGVVSTVSVIPAEMPALISTHKRAYRIGEDIDAIYRSLPSAEMRIKPAGGGGGAVAAGSVSGDGQLQVSTDQMPAGHYSLVAELANNATLTREVWLLEPDAVPAVDVNGVSFDIGDPIPVSWRNAPGNRNDYLSVVAPDAISDYDGGLAWLYVNAAPAGSLQLDGTTTEFGWPLQPGTYVVRLLKDDGYEVLAESATFTVQ